VLQVDREVGGTERRELLEALDVTVDGAEDAEPIDHLVGNERRVFVARAPVFVVVVAGAPLDVVRERGGDVGAVSVARHDVGDVVADHAPEPPHLVALVGEVDADVGGCGHAEPQRLGVAPGVLGGALDGGDRPSGDVGIGELQDVAVTDLPRERQRLRSVGGDPHLEAAVEPPGEAERVALVVDLSAVRELSDDVHCLAQGRERRGRAVRDAHRGVAAPDAADGAIAEHLVERGEQRRRDRPVACRRVRDHRTDQHLARVRQDLAVDHERLLPQEVRVERPHVAEPERLGATSQVDHARGGRIGL
jgi:hypothetical protein